MAKDKGSRAEKTAPTLSKKEKKAAKMAKRNEKKRGISEV